jgi:hypothetical protein
MAVGGPAHHQPDVVRFFQAEISESGLITFFNY